MHAIDLMAVIPEFYREQIGLSSLVDPSTGKTVPVQSHGRLQERSLSLDDAQAMRKFLRKQKELEDIIDSDAIEAVKAEATRDLEDIGQAITHYSTRTKDSAAQAANTVRKAIARLHKHLSTANDDNGNPHPVLRPFADHIQTHIIVPSARYSGHGGPYSKAGFPGCFTYEKPTGIRWLG